MFGEKAASSSNAEEEANRRGALVAVYVISTNRDQEERLRNLWSSIPCRFFVMRGGDFFHTNEGRYDSMGTDRLASLSGASYLHGHPALVFDGGTGTRSSLFLCSEKKLTTSKATTYSATNRRGQILGGGIGPGVQSKLKSMSRDTDALPEIGPDEVISRLNSIQKSGKPFPTFSRCTKDSMMSDVLQDIAMKGHHVIGQWLDKAYDQGNQSMPATSMFNSDHKVMCTGGDGEILMKLLQPNFGGVLESSVRSTATKPKMYDLEHSKNLQHYGIASVLSSYYNKRMGEGTNFHIHIGARVAKAAGGIVMLGTVTRLESVGGKREFRINWDESGSEQVSPENVAEMIKLFESEGQGKSKAPAKKKQAEDNGKKRAHKRAKPIDRFTKLVEESDPTSFIGNRVAKDFDGECYYGRLTEYDEQDSPAFWRVKYDDGDAEDYLQSDLIEALCYYEKTKRNDPG